jgi:hypothetical protein
MKRNESITISLACTHILCLLEINYSEFNNNINVVEEVVGSGSIDNPPYIYTTYQMGFINIGCKTEILASLKSMRIVVKYFNKSIIIHEHIVRTIPN